jgi:hypothetical protein
MTFLRYWPWWVALGWLLGYELWALWTQLQHRRGRRPTSLPTLSRMVWTAQRRWPPLRWVVLSVVGVLLSHFFAGWP